MSTSFITRLASFGFAFTMTFVMLAAVNTLAGNEPGTQQLVHGAQVAALAQV